MSYEKPEDKWKREKQYQPPAPGQAGPLPGAPADEARWLQEKQGRVAARPGGPGPNQIPPPVGPEAQWLREKQGQRPAPPPPNGPEAQWLREKQGQQPPTAGPEQQWLREKQGQPPVTQPGPEQQWLREKQGQPPVTQPGPEQQWLREKQGYAPGGAPPQAPGGPNRPPLTQQEIAWHQAKNVPTAKKSRTGLYIGLGIGAVALVVAIAVLAIVLLSPKSGPSTTPITTVASSGTVTSAAPTTATTTSPVVTTAPVTVAPTTPAISQAPVPTTISIGDSARLLALAQDADKNSRWEEVIQSLELLSTNDPNYIKGKPLLVKAYFQLGEQQVSQGANNEESANRALTYYRKASALDPSFAGLSNALQRAEKYSMGLLQYESEQYSQTVDTLKPLYEESQLEKEGVHYRNTADLLYNSYIKLGDNFFNLNNAADLAQARARYGQALALDVNNKDVANSKLQQVDRAIKLLGPTPTKK